MAINDIEIRGIEAGKGAYNGFVDPRGAIVKFGTSDSADFGNDEIVCAGKRYTSIFIGGD